MQWIETVLCCAPALHEAFVGLWILGRVPWVIRKGFLDLPWLISSKASESLYFSLQFTWVSLFLYCKVTCRQAYARGHFLCRISTFSSEVTPLTNQYILGDGFSQKRLQKNHSTLSDFLIILFHEHHFFAIETCAYADVLEVHIGILASIYLWKSSKGSRLVQISQLPVMLSSFFQSLHFFICRSSKRLRMAQFDESLLP